MKKLRMYERRQSGARPGAPKLTMRIWTLHAIRTRNIDRIEQQASDTFELFVSAPEPLKGMCKGVEKNVSISTIKRFFF